MVVEAVAPSACERSQRWAPTAESVRAARRSVEARVRALGLDGLADDAGLAVAELAANAVVHARTPFDVVVTRAGATGVRVAVLDDSPLPPLLGAAGETATSGRGLVLVAALAARWGAEVSGRGKAVWCELEPGAACELDDGPSAEDLLALWTDADEPPTAVVRGVPVAAALAAEEHVDDLLRELQLVVLAPGAAAVPDAEAEAALATARRVDAALRAFEDVRLQIRAQVARAAADGCEQVVLRLVLAPADADRARAYADAVEAAEGLAAEGMLLAGADEDPRHTALRQRLVTEVLAQLG